MSNSATAARRFFAVVPAAGSGMRLGGAVAKQYLPIGGQRMIEWSVNALLSASWIERIIVVVAADDREAVALLSGLERVVIAPVGGASRSDSVFNGLACLAEAADHDWVLVHDAARPALTLERLVHLRDSLQDDPVGGLLALPVADTIKRAADNEAVAATVPRDRLWLAQTPQMFRLGLLRTALERTRHFTDEAAAVEAAGYSPRLIAGARENFKVTTIEDFMLMQRLLAPGTTPAEPPDNR